MFSKKAFCLAVIALGIALLFIGAVLFSDRLAVAGSNLFERFHHISDGIALFMQNPLLGIGPDNWQYVYRFIQTHDYTTTVVHGGYVQIALDAGIVGLAFLLAGIAFGIKGLVARREWPAFFAVCAICVHALIDFDVQFAVIAALLVFLLVQPCGSYQSVEAQEAVSDAARARRFTVTLAASVVGLVLCSISFVAAASGYAIERAFFEGDNGKVVRLYMSAPFAREDTRAQTLSVKALASLGDIGNLQSFVSKGLVATDEQALSICSAFCKAGDVYAGERVLLDELKREPYNEAFKQVARALLDEIGIVPELESEFADALRSRA